MFFTHQKSRNNYHHTIEVKIPISKHNNYAPFYNLRPWRRHSSPYLCYASCLFFVTRVNDIRTHIITDIMKVFLFM